MKKLMLGLMMAFAVTAEAEIVKEYTLTDSLTATLDDQGVLTIIGSGAMPNWGRILDQVWSNERSQIKSVVAEGEVSIGEIAFAGCQNLKEVSLPNATEIGNNAFASCDSLTSVSSPNATTIGKLAFSSKGLKEVSLPSATTIGEKAFYDCDLLTSVSLPGATTIGGDAFNDCGSLTSVSLPNATEIGNDAFACCDSLTSVSFPNATEIGNGAFAMCGSLTSVSLPNATTIGQSAFFQCPKLEKIIVNAPMAMELKNNKSFYRIPAGCKILPEYCVVVPHSAEHTTAKVYTDGAEVTSNPIVVASNATAEVVFTAEWGYRFEDYTTVLTNTVTVTDDPTEVDGPEAIRNLVVIEPDPAEHSTAKVYTDGAEVTSNPIEVVSNATVEVVFTVVEEGYCFEDHSTVQTNTVTATDDPTKVDGPTVVRIPSLGEDEVRKAEWEAETTITVSTALKSDGRTLDKGEYEYACEFYGVEVKAEPTEADFKVVSKDAQVVQEDEIAVKKESIAAPSAGTVKVEDGKVQLGVTVLKTSNLTAEKKEWGEVTLSAEDVKVENGKIVISVPVDSASGFMILQSKDAKVEPSDNNAADKIGEARQPTDRPDAEWSPEMKKLPKFKTKQEVIDYFVEQKSDAMAKLKMADFALYPEMFDKKPVLKEVKEEEREKAIKIAKKAAKTVNWDLLGLDDKLLMRQLEGQYFKASLSI